MQDLLQSSQQYGLMVNSVFEAIATIRDAVAYAEVTRSPLCVLTIEFQDAFDNLSHEYLLEALCKYGFSQHFRKRIWSIYNSTSSVLQIPSPSNQELHLSEVSFKHDFVCNVLKPTPLCPGKLSPRSTDRTPSCKDLGCSIC